MPSPPPSLTQTAHDPARARIERQLQVLGDLAEIGLQVARAVEARSRDADTDINAVAMAYARTARAVRLTVMLQSRLVQALDDLDAAEDKALFRQREGHKARVERVIERVAKQACGDDEEAVDRLVIEAGERLDDEDLYGEVLQRPVGELVALICRDLGLDPDWSRLAEDAWAKEEIEDGAGGSPFAALGTARPPPSHGGGGPRRGGGGVPPPLPLNLRA